MSTLARWLIGVVFVFSLLVVHPSLARAADDEVLFWNAVGVRAMQVAPAVPGALQARVLALMHASIFDAVNGIEGRYEPIHVTADPPRGASQRAAAAQAAFTALELLFPAQAAAHAFDGDLATSLSGIADDSAIANSESVERGRAWGQYVANQIVAWGATDGVFPLTTDPGGSGIGVWRPTPPAFAPGMFVSLGTARPFFLPNPPTAFRPAGPRPILSAEYATDLNDIKAVGKLVSPTRTADQTESARFWAGAAASAWNRIAANAARERNTSLIQNARLFALLNMTAHDALIVAWDAQYFWDFWRPVTAIQLADLDGNSATAGDPSWLPLIVTPPYPDYYSGHQSISRPFAVILTAFFGNHMPVQTYSESLGTGVTRSWANFAAAADEAMMARVWGGLHFLFTMTDTRDNAAHIANHILEHALLPVNGQKVGQLSK